MHGTGQDQVELVLSEELCCDESKFSLGLLLSTMEEVSSTCEELESKFVDSELAKAQSEHGPDDTAVESDEAERLLSDKPSSHPKAAILVRNGASTKHQNEFVEAARVGKLRFCGSIFPIHNSIRFYVQVRCIGVDAGCS
jgi:hypothetical protein